MTRKLLSILVFLTIALSFTGYGCNGRQVPGPWIPPPQQGNGPFVTYFWCTAVKDAYVSSSLPYNLGGLSWDNVGSGDPNGMQRTYVQFYMPLLPATAQVTEAYINMYENSRQYPGMVSIDVALANDTWDPATISWIDQPNPPGPLAAGPTIGPYTDIPRWRGTSDISGYGQAHLDNPAGNFGFVLVVNSQQSIVRSFASLDHATRTAADMGQAPRLMLRVETDAPLTQANIIPGGLPLDNELGGRFNGPFTVSEQRFGLSAWPSEWDLAIN